MALRNPIGGPGATAFIASGLPFATGVSVVNNTTLHLNFPFVTRDIKLSCSVGVFLAFTLLGAAGTNRYSLSPGQNDALQLRVRDIYIRNESGVTASVSLVSGLAQVPVDDYPFVSSSFATGSNRMIYPGVG